MSKVEILKESNIPDYYSNGSLTFKNMKNFPFIKSKDGVSIVPVNMYLTSHLNTNNSESTIKRRAHCLNILVNYCENNKIDLKNFSEDNLIDLSYKLQIEKDTNGDLRNNTTINNILLNIISFYDFFGNMFLNNNYTKDILNVEEVLFNNKIVRKHRVLLPESDKTTRNPIYKNDIDLIYQNINQLYSSKFTQERVKVLLMLLEHTGARIGEVSLVKVSDIADALQNEKGLLKLKTLKKRKNSERFVPVGKEVLKQINMFIKIYRSKIIRKKLIKEKDHGFLFVNEKTGKKINTNSLSNDFNRITKELKLDNKICAHMFRHRFITNVFINLIKQYDVENKQGLRNALLDLNTLKAHVQELTGHKNIKSLDTYIHLAKSELANMPEILNKLEIQREKDGVEFRQRQLLNMLKTGEIRTEEYITEIEKLQL
jgi:site-specific recombinase XerD